MRLLTLFFASAATALSALEIRIDYTFDDNNFFNTQERRGAMEAVAKFYGDLLQDNLLRIDSTEFSATSTWDATFFHPSTGNTVVLPNPIIPEDTMIVYVGSRVLPGNTRGTGGPGGFGASGTSSWITRLLGRGQAGAEFSNTQSELRTDVGPWGGSISFDADSVWNFSQESNGPGTEFIRVALHEMGHVLGLGPSSPWDNLVVDGIFTGPAATASHGSAPPADGSHFLSSIDSSGFGSFGTTHGQERPVLMLPSSLDTGRNFDVITDLDLAALVDIGWEVLSPAALGTLSLSPTGASFEWPSSSFNRYQIVRTLDLQNEGGSSPVFSGTGAFQSWSDPSPEESQAFYQLVVSNSLNRQRGRSLGLSQQKEKSSEIVERIEFAPRLATGCYCEEHE